MGKADQILVLDKYLNQELSGEKREKFINELFGDDYLGGRTINIINEYLKASKIPHYILELIDPDFHWSIREIIKK